MLKTTKHESSKMRFTLLNKSSTLRYFKKIVSGVFELTVQIHVSYFSIIFAMNLSVATSKLKSNVKKRVF